jgi:hypothetical protein
MGIGVDYLNEVLDDLAGQRDQALRDLGKVEGAANLCNHFLGKIADDEKKESSLDVPDLDGLTMKKLRAVAKEAGLEGYSKLKRDELVSAIRGEKTR